MTVKDASELAVHELRQVVRGKRQDARQHEGRLATAFREAMRLIDAQRASGTPLAACLNGLEGVLRSVWPFTREWKYLCGNCDDTGYVFGECVGDATCGRHQEHSSHRFVTPCWCSRGLQMKPKPKPSADGFAAAGKSRPTRIGR